MAHTISIIGASGSVGSTLAAHILRANLLGGGDRLQLVGHGISSSSSKLLATRIDLMDAFDDGSVDIELVANIEDTEGDIVVMCAGTGLGGNLKDRRDLGRFNLPVFEGIAELCAKVVPTSLFIIVSNPVELAVEIFAEKLGRERVIGMGAEQDSLRFARAIAHDLELSRHEIFASVLGEHGQAMVPLWSSTKIDTNNGIPLGLLANMKKESERVPLAQRVNQLKIKVLDLLQREQIDEAYEVTRRALPDARIFAQPLITGHAIHSTPNATANATLQFLFASLGNNDRPLHGQVLLSDEFLRIGGVCGVPLYLNSAGWRIGREQGLSGDEISRLQLSAKSIASYLASVRS